MIRFFNKIQIFRSKLIPASAYIFIFNFKYLLSTLLGCIRGLHSALLGRVYFKDKFRPLILGPNIDFHLEKSSRIQLTNDDSATNINDDSSNKIFHSASSIGVNPHWNFMNPSVGRPTRIRIRENAVITFEQNTSILIGSYLAVWPNTELRIGANTQIGHGAMINIRCGLAIGRNVLMSHRVSIMDYDGHPILSSEGIPTNENTYGGTAQAIVIEDNVWIGFGATILKGVRIGQGAIIAAQACVTSDVAANTIVAGNPARTVKEGVTWRRY